MHRADLHPMTERDEGHFPGSPFSLPCVSPPLRLCWRRSSLISPEPTGLFFHLRIPPSRRRGRRAFHIFCLFRSLAAFQSVHFLPLCRRALSLSWPHLLCPAPLRDETFQSATSPAWASPASSGPAGVSPSSKLDSTGRETISFWSLFYAFTAFFLDLLEIDVSLKSNE